MPDDHKIPDILEDCDIQFGVYFAKGNLMYDLYCFACGKWVCKDIHADGIGYMMEVHENDPHE